MLDRQDLEMIRLVMKEGITASEMRMEDRMDARFEEQEKWICLLYTSPSPRD